MKRTKSKVFSIIFIVIMALVVYMPTLLLVAYSFTTSKTIGIYIEKCFPIQK